MKLRRRPVNCSVSRFFPYFAQNWRRRLVLRNLSGSRGLRPQSCSEKAQITFYGVSGFSISGRRYFRKTGLRRHTEAPFMQKLIINKTASAVPPYRASRIPMRSIDAKKADNPLCGQLPNQKRPGKVPYIRWMNSPLLSFGSNQVDFGGMRSPASATANSSSIEVGCSANATAMPPSTRGCRRRSRCAYRCAGRRCRARGRAGYPAKAPHRDRPRDRPNDRLL